MGVEKLFEYLEELYRRISQNMSKIEVGVVKIFLIKYVNLFIKFDKDMGRIGFVKYSIDIGDYKFIKEVFR